MLYHSLSDNELVVLLRVYGLCFKGKSVKKYREVMTSGVANSLGLSYKQVRRALERLVEEDYFDKNTIAFQQTHPKGKLWTRRSFYRIGSKLSKLTNP